MAFPPESLNTVLDDAIKIGLGAFVGAAGAILVAVLNHRHATQSERNQRKIDLLKEVGSRFAAVSGNYMARVTTEAQIPFVREIETARMKHLRDRRDTYPSNDKLHAELDQIIMLAHMADAPEVVDSMIEFIQVRDILGEALLAALTSKAERGVADDIHQQSIITRTTNLNEANGKVVTSLRNTYNRI